MRSEQRTTSTRSSYAVTSRKSSPPSGWCATTSALTRRRSVSGALTPGSGVRQAVPALGLEPSANPLRPSPTKRLPRVANGESIDVGEIGIVLDRDDPADQADVAVPAACIEHGPGSTGIAAQEPQAQPAFVHVQQHAAVLPVVPRGHRVR